MIRNLLRDMPHGGSSSSSPNVPTQLNVVLHANTKLRLGGNAKVVSCLVMMTKSIQFLMPDLNEDCERGHAPRMHSRVVDPDVVTHVVIQIFCEDL